MCECEPLCVCELSVRICFFAGVCLCQREREVKKGRKNVCVNVRWCVCVQMCAYAPCERDEAPCLCLCP